MEGVLARVSNCIEEADGICRQEGRDNYIRAEAIFSACLAILPPDAHELRALALGGLGRSLAGQGRFPFAEITLKKAVSQTSGLFLAANDPVRRLSLYGRIHSLVLDLGRVFVGTSAEGVYKAWRSVGWLLLGINTPDLVDIDTFPVHEDFSTALEAFLAAIWPREVMLSIPRLSELALWVSTLCKLLDRAPFAARVYEVAVKRADTGDLPDERMWELQRLRRDYMRSLLSSVAESAVTAADRIARYRQAEAQLQQLSNDCHGGLSLMPADAKLWADAEFTLGLIYANGLGVPLNCVEAARWFQQAADRGHANARSSLIWLYANGKEGGHGGEVSKFDKVNRLHQGRAESGQYRWFGYYDTGTIEGVARHDVEWWGPEEFNAVNVLEAEEWIMSLVNQWRQPWHWQALCYVNREPLPEAVPALVETTESDSCPPGFQPSIKCIDVAGDICGGSTFGEFKENLPRSGTEIWNKWIHPGNIETSWIEYSYFEPIKLTTYGVCSANDCPHRDPVAWRVSVRELADGMPVWKTVHVFERNDNVFPERWQWKHFTFAQEQICVGFRLEITAVRAAGDSIQLGHLHVFGTPLQK
eukprot:gene26187-31621_t